MAASLLKFGIDSVPENQRRASSPVIGQADFQGY
jgi:hypothetical protein